MTKQKKLSYNELKKMVAGHKHTISIGIEQYKTLNSMYNLECEKGEIFKMQINDLKNQLSWYKQQCQNLSEAICAHMRNR